jgi:AcrR family transcriptional regulator
VLDAARELPPQDVTLAAVGARLGVTSPALYRYFPDRAAILEALATEARDHIVPPPADLPWDSWLREAGRRERDLWRTHTELYASADYRATNRPRVRMFVAGMRVLIDAGFAREDAVAGVTIITELAHAVGYAETRRNAPSDLPPESEAELRELLGDGLPARLDEVLERAMDIAIEGLQARLAR